MARLHIALRFSFSVVCPSSLKLRSPFASRSKLDLLACLGFIMFLLSLFFNKPFTVLLVIEIYIPEVNALYIFFVIRLHAFKFIGKRKRPLYCNKRWLSSSLFNQCVNYLTNHAVKYFAKNGHVFANFMYIEYKRKASIGTYIVKLSVSWVSYVMLCIIFNNKLFQIYECINFVDFYINRASEYKKKKPTQAGNKDDIGSEEFNFLHQTTVPSIGDLWKFSKHMAPSLCSTLFKWGV